MRKHPVVIAVIALSVCAWGMSASALNSPKVFSLLDVSSPNTPPINGFTFNRLPRAGDQFAIMDNLYKWAGAKKGALAGRVEGIGTFLSVGDSGARALFVAQAHLNGGTVLVQGYGLGNFGGRSMFTFPVVGGTGIYANARGYVVVRDLGSGDSGNSNVAFHLLP